MKLLLSALALLFLIMSFSVSKQAAKPYFFIQMSDPQFGMFSENKSFEQETKNFEKAIAEANRLHPAFVIVCGDLVNKGGDAAQIAEYKRIAGTLDRSIPLYSLPGNHDVGNNPTSESIAAYRKNIGSDYYTFENGNLFGIVLNSSLIKEPDGAKPEAAAQEAWLNTALEKGRKSKKTMVVFQHHSWFLGDANELDQYFNISTPVRKKYLSLFEKYGIKYVFAGHYHRNASGHTETLQMVTTGPVGKPLGSDKSGFRIVTVQGGQMTYNYYGLDSIPAQIQFKK
jgi:3',5'-cyclic AMP phosphodiesterase CpdA